MINTECYLKTVRQKIPVKYDDFGYLKDGVNVYSVKLSGKYFYINDRNEIIKRPKY